MVLKSSVSTSRNSAVAALSSDNTFVGPVMRLRLSVSDTHWSMSWRKSASSSATSLPSAMVRTMTPKLAGLMLWMRRRKRPRSSEPLIFCEMDIRLMKGVSTR